MSVELNKACVLESQQVYNSKRSIDDIDLITIVRELLVKAGATDNALHVYDTSPIIIEGQNKIPLVQRFHLNRFWYHQLCSTEANTLMEHQYLIDTGTPEVWLSVFKERLFPFLMKHGLPHPIC